MAKKKVITKKEPSHLTEEYHKSRRQLVLWSGILFAWELIGINLEDVTGEIGGVAKSIKSPQAIPWMLLVLVAYFFYRLIIEWLQCESQRRHRMVSRVDFMISLGIALMAFFLFSVHFRLADKISSLGIIQIFGIMSGMLVGMGIFSAISIISLGKTGYLKPFKSPILKKPVTILAGYTYLMLIFSALWYFWSEENFGIFMLGIALGIIFSSMLLLFLWIIIWSGHSFPEILAHGPTHPRKGAKAKQKEIR
jgi:hypothetical protein